MELRLDACGVTSLEALGRLVAPGLKRIDLRKCSELEEEESRDMEEEVAKQLE